MSTDWQMPRPAAACTGCARPFDVGQPLQAHLVETPTGYERRDYCLSCTPVPGPQVLATWRTRRPAPTPRRSQRFDRTTAYQIFRSLDADDTQKERLRFLLALVLWRRNVLRLTGRARRDGRELWEFLHTASGQEYRIECPRLPEEDLERLSRQLQELLSGLVPQAEAATAAGEKRHA